MNRIKRHNIIGIGIFSVILSLALILSGWQMYYVKDNQSQAHPNHKTIGTIIGGKFVVTVGTVEAVSTTDYTCDGTADEVQMQAALDALPATGGMIQILGGTYNWTAGNNTVARAIDDVEIVGAGYGTLFNCDATNDLWSAGSQDGWIFSYFSTDAGGITYSSATNYTLRNVKVGSTFLAPVEPNTSTVIHALVPIQINTSSVGDTYTDVAGDTYAETTNQTRITTTATYKRPIAIKVSAHVSAGTGTIQLWDVTSSTELANITTTATSETSLSPTTVTVTPTNAGDVVTIRVKNSGAGNTITIDAGGMMEADVLTHLTANGNTNSMLLNSGYISSMDYALLGGLSTAAATIQTAYIAVNNLYYVNYGSPSSTLNSAVSVDPEVKNIMIIRFILSGLTGQVLLGQAVEISCENK